MKERQRVEPLADPDRGAGRIGRGGQPAASTPVRRRRRGGGKRLGCAAVGPGGTVRDRARAGRFRNPAGTSRGEAPPARRAATPPTGSPRGRSAPGARAYDIPARGSGG